MDYTLSNSYVTDAGTGQRMHSQAQAVPTAVSDLDVNSVTWSLMELVKAAGLTGVQFDKATPATYQRLRQALNRLMGNNYTFINAAVSPYAITADNAGLVVLDASAGSIVVNLPATTALSSMKLEFLRVDGTANTVTVNRSGTDTIDGATSFTLTEANSGRTIRSNGGGVWRTPLNNTASLSSNGWQRLPSGLIVQWMVGITSVTNGADSVFNWPIAFPATCLFATAAYTEFSSPWSDITTPLFVTAKSTAAVTLRSYTGNDNGVSIFGLGR